MIEASEEDESLRKSTEVFFVKEFSRFAHFQSYGTKN